MSTTSKVLCANNAVGTLQGLHSVATTTFLLNGSQGSKFPEIADENCFYLTVEDTLGNFEIVKVISRSTDTLTVIRGQSGTTAREWQSGTEVSVRATAELFEDKVSLKEHEARWTSEKTTINSSLATKFDKIGGTVSGGLTVTGAFKANGTSTVANLSATGNITATGNATIYGNARVTGLTVTGDTAITNLTVSGTSTVAALSASGNVTVAGTITATGGVKEKTIALSASLIDLALANCFTKTIRTATTFTISNAGSCSCFNLILTNGGSYTVTWPASIKWSGGLPPSLSINGVDVLTFLTPDSGATWYGAVSLLGAA